MIEFVKNLQKEMNRNVEKIERTEENVIKKSLEVSHILGESFDRLREFIVSYEFENEAEEIEFFKEIKPQMFYRLIYYRKIYNIEMNRPLGVEVQKEYLLGELEAINKYTAKRLDFIRYYRSGATHLDSIYFLRGKTDIEQYLETFYYELDSYFSTNCDFIVAKILSNDMLSAYLLNELEALDMEKHIYNPFSGPRPTWQDSKSGLIELIYGLDSKGSFGNVPLTQLANYITMAFNVKMDMNLSRTFSDMKIRNNPTSWTDDLKAALIKRMQLWKRNKKK